MSPDDPSDPRSPGAVYSGAVREIIDARARNTTYQPRSAPDLRLARYRMPTSVDELTPSEQRQLQKIWSPVPLADVLADPENQVEVADVADASGRVLYQLFAWNYGVGYLLENGTTDVVAMGTQHDIEIWSQDQRDLFFAMDRALRASSPTFQQPLCFDWWSDDEWGEAEESPRSPYRLRSDEEG